MGRVIPVPPVCACLTGYSTALTYFTNLWIGRKAKKAKYMKPTFIK
jgi:hypothetical protein